MPYRLPSGLFPGRRSVKILAFCWSLMFALAFSGCASDHPISKKEQPPLSEKTLLKHWQHVSKEACTPTRGPLTVDQVIAEALKASPELEQIKQRIEAASEQIRQADASFYPRLVVSERFNTTNNPVYALMNIINQRRLRSDVNFNDPGTQQDFSTRIRADWSLFEGGSRYYQQKAAVDHRDSAQAALLAARNQMVAKVVEIYYRWLQALGFIGVAEKGLTSADTDVKLAEARYKAEMALPSEIMRLKAHQAEMHGNLVTARTGARRLQAGLERFLARPIRKEEIPDPSISPPSTSPQDAPDDTDSLVEQAMKGRPELASVRALIQAARKRVQAERGGMLPRLGMGAEYQWNTETFSEMEGSWLVGIEATWSLFEGGVTLSRIREARVRLKEIETRGEQVALDIALEVHQAALSVEEAAEKIQVTDERRKWAEKALMEVRELYRNQMVTVDSLLQAEVASNQAEVSYTAALFDGKIAQVLLRQTLGDFADWTEERHG
jgi:outer membrane protein